MLGYVATLSGKGKYVHLRSDRIPICQQVSSVLHHCYRPVAEGWISTWLIHGSVFLGILCQWAVKTDAERSSLVYVPLNVGCCESKRRALASRVYLRVYRLALLRVLAVLFTLSHFLCFFHTATGNGPRGCLKFTKTNPVIPLTGLCTGLTISSVTTERNIYVPLFTASLSISISYWILPLLY